MDELCAEEAKKITDATDVHIKPRREDGNKERRKGFTDQNNVSLYVI